MKQFLFLLFTFAIGTLKAQESPTCGDWDGVLLQTISSCDNFEHGNWELVFEDNFNQSYNTEIWFSCYDGWNRQHGDELQYYLDDNILVENGSLKLQAKREPGYYPIKYKSNGVWHETMKYFEYTSGMLQSKSKFQYGFFEIRCKIPAGQGFWPAFWLFGNGGEIDIFEFNGSTPKKHYTTIHTWPDEGEHEICPTSWTNSSSFSNDFHTFSLEWDEYKLVFRVDGIIKRIDYKYINSLTYGLDECIHQTAGLYLKNPLYPENAQNLIINLAIANDSTGTYGPGPDTQTPFPSSLDVDYVRVYKKKNPSKDISIHAFDDKKSDYFTANTISVAGENSFPTISNGEIKKLIACENIMLYPGFTANEGCSFEAKISSGTRFQPFGISNDVTYYTETASEIFSSNKYSDKSNKCEMYEGNEVKKETGEEHASILSHTSNDMCEVFPNPNSGCFQIKLNSDVESYLYVQIINEVGEIIYSVSNPQTQFLNVCIDNYHTGVFFVKCTTSTYSGIKKIIIR